MIVVVVIIIIVVIIVVVIIVVVVVVIIIIVVVVIIIVVVVIIIIVVVVIVVFAVPANHKVKVKESEKIKKYLQLAKKLRQNVEYEDDAGTNYSGCSWKGPQRLEELEIRVRNRNHSYHSIVKIG